MKKYILLSLSLFICFLSCDKDEKVNRPYARIRTLGIQNINTSGVSISAEIYNASKLNIEDHGFVYILKNSSALNQNNDSWNIDTDFDIASLEPKKNEHIETNYEKESLGSKNGDGVFESTLTRNLIRNAPYLAKAYVVSNGITTYGEPIEFASMGGIGPVITKIVPNTAYYGDTINLIGNHFSNQSRYNKIFFNELRAQIIYSSDTLIKTIVPERDRKWKATSKIKMELALSTIKSIPDFHILSPKIDSVSSKKIVSGMTVKIYGSKFNDLSNFSIDGKSSYLSNLERISDSLITVTIPLNIDLGKIPIRYNHLSETITIPDFFESTKPVIESVRPLKVWMDTLLQVRGPYVGYLGSLLSSFGSPERINDSLVQVLVKYAPSTNKISGYYNGENIFAKDVIEWLPPVVTSVSPQTVYSGDKITVHGERFSEGLLVAFENYIIRVDYIDDKTIEFVVPQINSGQHNIKLQDSHQIFQVQENITFEVPAISITAIHPSIAKRGDTIDISLENINPNSNYSAFIDGQSANLIEVNETGIRVKIGNKILLSDKPSVQVNSEGRTDILEMGFQAIEPWEQIMKIENINAHYSSIAHPNNIPVMLTKENYNGNYVLLQYNEGFNNWAKIATYDLTGTYPYLMSKNEMMYFVNHDKDSEDRKIIKITSYSTSNMEWTAEGSFLYEGETNELIAFLKEDKIYVGDKSVMKSFDLDNKTWENKTIVPTDEWGADGVNSSIINNRCYVSFNNDDKTNDSSQSEFWEYDTALDKWIYIPGCPYYKSYGSSFANNDSKIFSFIAKGNSLRELWGFDPFNNKWEKYLSPAGTSTNSTSFVHNNFLYFGDEGKYGVGLNLKRIHLHDLIKLEE